MPASQQAKTSRRLKTTGPRCRGGASSLLRLTQATLPRLPTGGEVEDWLNRMLAKDAQDSTSGTDTDWPVGETHASIITRLLPSRELAAARGL